MAPFASEVCVHRLKGRVGLCAAVAMCVVAAGCGGATPPDPHSSAVPSATGDAPRSEQRDEDEVFEATVSWAEDYCGAVSELVRSVSRMPTVDASTVQRASETSGELLQVVVGGLERTLDRLDNLDPPPVQGAEEVRRDAVATYSAIRDHARGVLDELETARGPEASREAVSSVKEPLDDIGDLNLLGEFDSVPALSRASRQAPACQQLTGSDPAPRLDSPGP